MIEKPNLMELLKYRNSTVPSTVSGENERLHAHGKTKRRLDNHLISQLVAISRLEL